MRDIIEKGYDTDSNAALLGALLGAKQDIPEKYLKKIKKVERIEEIFENYQKLIVLLSMKFVPYFCNIRDKIINDI